MSENKKIISYCPNFYKIVNFEYENGDNISDKIISIYREYIFKINLCNEEDVERIKKIDSILSRYIDDYTFRKELKKEIVNIRIPRDTMDILKAFIESIINIFNNYEKYTTRVIYISRWI